MKHLLKKMAAVANELDINGFEKEANQVTMSMLKMSQTVEERGDQYKISKSSLEELDKFVKDHSLSLEDAYAYITGKYGPRQANDYVAWAKGQSPSGQAAGAGAAGQAGGQAGGQAAGQAGQAGGAGGSGAVDRTYGTITYKEAEDRGIIGDNGQSIAYVNAIDLIKSFNKLIQSPDLEENAPSRHNVEETKEATKMLTIKMKTTSTAILNYPYMFLKEKSIANYSAQNAGEAFIKLVGAKGKQYFFGGGEAQYSANEYNQMLNEYEEFINAINGCQIIKPRPAEAPASQAPQGQPATPATPPAPTMPQAAQLFGAPTAPVYGPQQPQK